MAKFLFRTIIFFFLILIVQSIIGSMMPYYSGNVWYGSKIEELKSQNNDQINVGFWGSSRTYRQIDPQIIDAKLNEASAGDYKSFNFGAPATATPQSYYLYENFIASDKMPKLKVAVLELNGIRLIEKAIEQQERAYYWVSLKEFIFVIKYVLAKESFGLRTKAIFFNNYAFAFLRNFFNVGEYKDMLVEDNYFDSIFIGENRDGFFPLEIELKTYEKTVKTINRRRNDFLKKPAKLQGRFKESMRLSKAKELVANPIHFERIKDLIAKSKSKGIDLVFLLPPKYSNEEARALFNKIPLENKIDLNDGSQYPQLYDIENSFDVGHFNNKGAEIYSTLVGNKLTQLITAK